MASHHLRQPFVSAIIWEAMPGAKHRPIDCIKNCVRVVSIQIKHFAGTLRVETMDTCHYVIIRFPNDKSKTVIFNSALHLFFEIGYDGLSIPQRT